MCDPLDRRDGAGPRVVETGGFCIPTLPLVFSYGKADADSGLDIAHNAKLTRSEDKGHGQGNGNT